MKIIKIFFLMNYIIIVINRYEYIKYLLWFNINTLKLDKNNSNKKYIDNIKRKYIHSIVSFRSWNYEFLIFITRYGWLWDKKINNKSFYGNNIGKINYLYYLIRVLLRNWVDIVMVIIIRI